MGRWTMIGQKLMRCLIFSNLENNQEMKGWTKGLNRIRNEELNIFQIIYLTDRIKKINKVFK